MSAHVGEQEINGQIFSLGERGSFKVVCYLLKSPTRISKREDNVQELFTWEKLPTAACLFQGDFPIDVMNAPGSTGARGAHLDGW